MSELRLFLVCLSVISASALADASDIVVLKNGAAYPKAVVKLGMNKILPLIKSSEIEANLAMYELTEKARNPDHIFFSGYSDILVYRGLIEENGEMEPFLKDIVLSAAVGQGLSTRWVNPIASPGCEGILESF